MTSKAAGSPSSGGIVTTPSCAADRIEVHARDHGVVARALDVRDEVLVLGLEEREVVDPLERRVGAPHGVEAADQREQRPVERCAS